jgi:hypothetical protein
MVIDIDIELFESPDPTQIFVRGVGWRANSTKGRKLDTRDDLLARILDAAARKMIRDENELRRTTCDLHKLVTKCTEVGGGILEHFLWTVTKCTEVDWGDSGTLAVDCNKVH